MAGALVASVALAGGASAASGPDLLSITTTGATANELSQQTTLSLSADGHKAVFVSASASLVAGDTNGVKDVFLRNLDSGATRRVSVSSAEVQADGASSSAMISADGRFVVFTSSATNLVPGDTNGVADVFVRDLTTGATDRITDGNALSGDVPSSISADGSFVTFASSASNLVAGDTDGARDVFLWNRSTGGIRLIAPGGGSAIAADGAAIAVGGGPDIVLVDRSTGASTPLGAGTGAVLTPGAVAAGGTRVVFQTSAALAADDTNGLNDVYAWSPGGVQLVSRGAAAPGNSVSFGGWVSANGRYVSFDSQATNLDPADRGTDRDVFVRDLTGGETRLVSTSFSLTQTSMSSTLSADGSAVAFDSTAADLVAGDTSRAGGGWDAFRFDSPFQLTSDTEAPAILCDAPDGAWHAADVTLHCTASDAGLGLASAGDAGFDLHTSVAAGTESANASTDSRQVCDLAGNCAQAGPIAGNKVDRLAPQITITAPADGQAVTQGDALIAQYSCSDAGSGIGSCAGPVASGAAVSTSSTGQQTFTVTAVDGAGNQTQETVAWTVKAPDVPPPSDPPGDPTPPPGTFTWLGWAWPTAHDGTSVAWFHTARLHFALGGQPGDDVVDRVQVAPCGASAWSTVDARTSSNRGWHWGWWHRHHGWGAHQRGHGSHHRHGPRGPADSTAYTVQFHLDWRTRGCVAAKVKLTDGSSHLATVWVW
jgi:Tol biopolymer transport system component